ncbi:hypothetical protein [Comamonas sediminis]|uniref:Scaffolding protein n=1 Tax=Comamonas sediminis TaxID=1783360 RepID=A0ABV4B0A0_9BURK
MTTEDRNRLLSAEELEALEDDDYDADADNAAALAALGQGPLDGDDNDDDNDNDDDQNDDDKAGTDKPDDGGEAGKLDGGKQPEADKKPEGGESEKKPDPTDKPDEDQGAAGKDAGTPAAKGKGGYSVTVPDDLDTQLADNRKAMHALRRSLNDGDIDADEYEAKLDELEDKRDSLRDLKNRASIAEEMRQQSQADAWLDAINTFVAHAAKSPELGIIDYTKDTAKQAEFDTFLRAIAAQPGNENRASRWLLEEAHKRMVVLHSIPTTAAKPGAVNRKPDTSKVVNTLADVPGGAGDADPISNEFAELDKLEGLDYERALSELKTRSPEKHARYLRSA